MPKRKLTQFTCADPNAAVSDFALSVTWPGYQGYPTTPSLSLSGGVFSIKSSQPFSEEGTYRAHIVLTDNQMPTGINQWSTDAGVLVQDPAFTNLLKANLTPSTKKRQR
jgi:hypothetical protein